MIVQLVYFGEVVEGHRCEACGELFLRTGTAERYCGPAEPRTCGRRCTQRLHDATRRHRTRVGARPYRANP